jgi:hypothetical protein
MWGKVYAMRGKRATEQGAVSTTAAPEEARAAAAAKQSHTK